MQIINSSTDLAEAILLLENNQAEDLKMLKKEFHFVYESIKPANLIKSVFKEVTQSGDLKDNIVNTSIGLATGFISKMIFERSSKNPLKKLFGSIIMFGMTNFISKNPEPIKLMGNKVLEFISNKPSESEIKPETSNT